MVRLLQAFKGTLHFFFEAAGKKLGWVLYISPVPEI